MTEESNKINLIRLKTHQRIREIILLRLIIMLKEMVQQLCLKMIIQD